jgi:hypothetical protein
MNKANQKAIDRATTQGRGALLRTLALIHRAAPKRTQNEIEMMIEKANAWDDFTMRNGALLHNSEV